MDGALPSGSDQIDLKVEGKEVGDGSWALSGWAAAWLGSPFSLSLLFWAWFGLGWWCGNDFSFFVVLNLIIECRSAFYSIRPLIVVVG